MKTFLFSVSAGMALLVLCHCQRPADNPKTQFQLRADSILEDMVNKISNAKRGITQSQARGVDFGGGPWGGGGPYGGYYMRPLQQEVEDCASFASSFPRTVANYALMAVSFAGCLARILADQSPVFTNTHRNLDRWGQSLLQYLVGYRNPNPLQSTFPEQLSGPRDFLNKGSIWGDYSQ